MNIISVSRRTDIPCFYGQWFLERIKEGFAHSKNPFNQKQSIISLLPNDVLAFVFWSKNFAPFIPYLQKIEKDYTFYFHYTITGLSKSFESHSPSTNDAIENFILLSKRYSKERVIWRFDPIVLSNKTPLSFYKANFSHIAKALKGYSSKCYFSFVQTHYRKVKWKFKKHKDIVLNDNAKKKILLDFMQIEASKNGFKLYSCCQPEYALGEIEKASCIDKKLIKKLLPKSYPNKLEKIKKAPTRIACGCYKSVDIGVYNSCQNSCIYCYATGNTINI